MTETGTKVKICGLFREPDAAYVNEAEPDYAGFVLRFPKSHRNLTPERAAALREKLSPDIRAVGVFVDQPAETVAEDAARIGLDVVQLHGHEDDEFIARLREKFTRGQIWKAFRVRSAADLAAALSSTANEILLDNGYGTGEPFDWRLAEGHSLKRRRFILAGGLTPENLPQAIATLRPWCVDLSSGVETDKVKDRDKIKAAVEAVRKGT